jgi:hypothetical protein
MKRLMVLAMFFLFLMTACGDSGHSYNGKGSLPPPVDRSCCPIQLDANSLLCGQCTLEKPCRTEKLFVSIVCDENVFYFVKGAFPNQQETFDIIYAPTRSNPLPPNACCPAKECGILTAWCTFDNPCPIAPGALIGNLSIYYQPDVYDIPPGTFDWIYSPGWKLKEWLPCEFGPCPQYPAVWPIYPNQLDGST